MYSIRLHLKNLLFAEKLMIGVPANKILEDIKLSSTIEKSVKRIHLLKKKDIQNIKRDFNIISYSTKMKKCADNVSYFDICKNIHTYNEGELDNYTSNLTQLQESVCEYIDIDNEIVLTSENTEENKNIINNEKIKDKLVTIFGMVERANITKEDEAYINNQCDKIITKLGEKTDYHKH